MSEQLDGRAPREDGTPDPTPPVAPARADPPRHEHGRPRIVVVGGGAAGLELATGLGNGLGRRGRAEIALVECTRMHLWKPLFHEVAAGSLDFGEYELSYLAQAHWHNFR